MCVEVYIKQLCEHTQEKQTKIINKIKNNN